MSVEETPQYIVTTPGDGIGDDLASKVSASMSSSRSISQSSRSHSLQSSTSSTIVAESSSSSTSSLIQHQNKAQSSANIIEKHYQQKSTTTKGKFQSFLQHPDAQSSHHGTSFLTAQQKHVRQFVRSTSAHSETGVVAGVPSSAGAAKADKYNRSASTQIEDGAELQQQLGITSNMMEQHQSICKGLQQSSTILISKSAETIETKCTTTGAMRTQLTLSGGFLAPPNRKLTILSPIHAPPGLHDMMKRHGRSPLSPRIGFPGSDMELFP